MTMPNALATVVVGGGGGGDGGGEAERVDRSVSRRTPSFGARAGRGSAAVAVSVKSEFELDPPTRASDDGNGGKGGSGAVGIDFGRRRIVRAVRSPGMSFEANDRLPTAADSSGEGKRGDGDGEQADDDGSLPPLIDFGSRLEDQESAEKGESEGNLIDGFEELRGDGTVDLSSAGTGVEIGGGGDDNDDDDDDVPPLQPYLPTHSAAESAAAAAAIDKDEEEEIYCRDSDEDKDDEDEDEEDDEDDDDFPQLPLVMARFVRIAAARRAGWDDSDDDDRSDDEIRDWSDDGEDDESSDGGSDSDDDDGGSTADPASRSSCAICFRRSPSSSTSPAGGTILVTLPCCGADGREDTSSTRFCARCVLKLARREYDDIAEPPEKVNGGAEEKEGDAECVGEGRAEAAAMVRRAYLDASGGTVRSGLLRVGECPRCRSLLAVSCAVEDGEDDSEDGADSGQCTCEACVGNRLEKKVRTADDLVLRSPPYALRAWHAARRVELRVVLRMAGHAVRCDRVPLGLLAGGGGGENGRERGRDDADKLCRWGLLQRRRRPPPGTGVPSWWWWPRRQGGLVKESEEEECGGLEYQIDPNGQAVLRAACAASGGCGCAHDRGDDDEDEDEDDEDNEPFLLTLFGRYCSLGNASLRSFQVGAALFMYNQALATALFANGFIPKPPYTTPQSWVLSILNCLLACLVVQCLSIAAVYAAVAILLAMVVGKSMSDRKFPPKLLLALVALIVTFKLLKVVVVFAFVWSVKAVKVALVTAFWTPLGMFTEFMQLVIPERLV